LRILGQISGGLEELGAGELKTLGAERIEPVYRGVFFETDTAGTMRVNYCSRLFDRFLLPVARFSCSTSDGLYGKALKHPWENLFGVNSTFSITSAASGKSIRNSKWAALRLKDAIADHFREICGKRPSVDRRDADVKLDLRVRGTMAEIRLDLSGGALHRRGYRKETVKAPMRETTAAAALAMSGWDGSRPLVDPMCGSGTLLCEALMAHCRIPAGFYRTRWGFFRMEGFSKLEWKKVKAEADDRIISLEPGLISGSDLSMDAVMAARANLDTFRDGSLVKLKQEDWRGARGYEDSFIITNPPHGIRIFEETAGALLNEFGNFLKQKCRGSEAWVFVGDTKLLKKVGLRTSKRLELPSGGLDGRLARYELY